MAKSNSLTTRNTQHGLTNSMSENATATESLLNVTPSKSTKERFVAFLRRLTLTTIDWALFTLLIIPVLVVIGLTQGKEVFDD